MSDNLSPEADYPVRLQVTLFPHFLLGKGPRKSSC